MIWKQVEEIKRKEINKDKHKNTHKISPHKEKTTNILDKFTVKFKT